MLREDRHPEVWSTVQSLSARLGIPPPDLYLFRGEGAWGAASWPVEPPVVLLGHDHLVDGPRRLAPAALEFLLAVELAHLSCKHPMLSFDATTVNATKSAYSVFGGYAGHAETVVDLVTLVPGVDQVAKLQQVIRLSRKVFAARGAADKLTSVAFPVLDWLGVAKGETTDGVGREGLQGAAMQMRLQADRAALLLCGDARAAVDAILQSSSDAVKLRMGVLNQGLLPLMEEGPPSRLAADEILRLTALVEFSAGLPLYFWRCATNPS